MALKKGNSMTVNPKMLSIFTWSENPGLKEPKFLLGDVVVLVSFELRPKSFQTWGVLATTSRPVGPCEGQPAG